MSMAATIHSLIILRFNDVLARVPRTWLAENGLRNRDKRLLPRNSKFEDVILLLIHVVKKKQSNRHQILFV